MFDIKAVQQEAQKEINEEIAARAKSRIKAKLKQIADTKVILANLEREYDDLLRAIADGN